MSATDRKWLIWSFEHRAWWKPAERGYTTDVREAGRYDHDKALEICVNANLYMKDEPNEVMVPLALTRTGKRAWSHVEHSRPLTTEEIEIFRFQRNRIAGGTIREHLGTKELSGFAKMEEIKCPEGACPDCGGEGFTAGYADTGPTQDPCERCRGTGVTS